MPRWLRALLRGGVDLGLFVARSKSPEAHGRGYGGSPRCAGSLQQKLNRSSLRLLWSPQASQMPAPSVVPPKPLQFAWLGTR